MNNNIFISNLKTNRHGRGVLSYRELDYEQGEYVVDGHRNVEAQTRATRCQGNVKVAEWLYIPRNRVDKVSFQRIKCIIILCPDCRQQSKQHSKKKKMSSHCLMCRN